MGPAEQGALAWEWEAQVGWGASDQVALVPLHEVAVTGRMDVTVSLKLLSMFLACHKAFFCPQHV